MRNIVVACDGSEQSLHALDYAVGLAKKLGSFELHLVSVMPPMTYLVSPAAPIATAGAVAAVTHQWEVQKKADEAASAATLRDALERCHTLGIGRGDEQQHIKLHSLPAAGGASGVAASLVEFVKKLEDAVTVLGSRGHGAFARSMMGVIGLGSVGEYCVNNLTSPVIIIKTKQTSKTTEEAPLVKVDKVCVCVDDSQEANNALNWALETLVTPSTQLHVIAVAAVVPMPVPRQHNASGSLLQMLDEAAVAISSVTTAQWEAEKRRSLANAEGCCANAIDVALKAGLSKSQLYWKALLPEGGASDVAESIAHYVRDNGMDTCVVGSHGYGAWKRSMMSVLGLGSVSLYCVHNLPCAIAVVKSSKKIEPALRQAASTESTGTVALS